MAISLSEAAVNFHVIAGWVANSLAFLFAAAALFHLAGPGILLRSYRQWGYGHGFHYAVGSVLALVALFLAVAETRIWGGILGAIVLFFTATSLLNREKYLFAASVILVMVALAPAMA
jgi:hypothetical protein